jgi:hypothetical protein
MGWSHLLPKGASTMKIGRFAKQFQHSMMAFVLAGVCPRGALAQNGHSHETTAQPQQLTSAQSALLKTARVNEFETGAHGIY